MRFDDKIYVKEDALFCMQCFDKTEKICHLNNTFYNYCYNSNSALNNKNFKKELTSLDAMSKMIEILKNNNINNYLQEECDYIGRLYNYKSILKKEKVCVDFSSYEERVKQYLNEGLLRKNISFKNKLKVILATKFTKLYLLIINLKNKIG